jgi:hypothetical protein
MDAGHQAIEKVTYLASLVSNRLDVDPMLDTLRAITSRFNAGDEIKLTNEERQRLEQLEAQLAEYLITKDPVRSFTAESLSKQLERHFEHTDPLRQANRHARRQIFTIIGVGLVGYALGLAIIPGPFTARFALSSPIFMLVLGIGTAWLFWATRSALVPSMRKSFALFSLAVTISAFTSTQYPLIASYPGIGDLPLFHYGGFIVPYAIMYALLYAGFYQLSRQFSATWVTKLAQPRAVVPVAALLVAASFVLPHTATDFDLFYRISLAGLFLDILFCGMGALVGLSAARQLTRRYAGAVRALALAAASYCVVGSALLVMMLVTGSLNPANAQVAAVSTFYSLALLLEMVSAYLFRRNIQE